MPRFLPALPLSLAALAPFACGGTGGGSGSATAGMTSAGPTGSTTQDPTTTALPTTGGASEGSASEGGTTTTTTSTSEGASVSAGTTGFKFDTPQGGDFADDTGVPPPTCHVVDDMDAIGDCSMKSPPDSFEPEVQWSWGPPGDGNGSATTPLVANLTDDNGDGAIDLCDVPDIVVVVGEGLGGKIYVLDGATGQEHLSFPTPVDWFVTPAIGDIDNDGLPEIVSATPGGILGPSALLAFEHDGTLKWTSADKFNHDQGGGVALGDLDNDGDVEIVCDDLVVDHEGKTLFIAPEQVGWTLGGHSTATTLADLDGDLDLEVVLGQAAYHHDGTVYYNRPQTNPGFPSVANLDQDAFPEVLITNMSGITILEHDGALKFQNIKPTGDNGFGAWFRPSTVHDFDGDKVSEFATSSAAHYSVFETNATVVWTANVLDASGWAAGTAFDFLGDGVAEAMYADEATLYVFDGAGKPLLSVPRSSKTLIEYPVVADVDNDGSAEIVVVSALDWDEQKTSPTVQVIRDKQDRWIQARRIWNQHTYHVTNVREDATIPQFEPRSWEHLNTFRTNAQIENGALCKPKPPM